MLNRSEAIRTKDPKRLAQLVEDPDIDTRLAVAWNDHTWGSTLSQLAKDTDPQIRWQVTQNPNTTDETLEELTHDKDDIVQKAALVALMGGNGRQYDAR